MRLFAVATLLAVVAGIAACASSPPPPPGPVVAARTDVTPPPVTTTPVPIVKAKTVSGSGRVDPFIVLFGPPSGVTTPKVAVSTFPNIPTLPGFENAPGAAGPWQSVRLTGVMHNSGYIAIVEADGKSYFVRPGDRIDDKFRVISIGPDYITLATNKEERHFSLGG